MRKTTWLAWYQLTREKTRLLLAIAGIAFANILIFMQLGFLFALFEGAVRPHLSLAADVVVTHPKQQTFFSPVGFSRRRLYQVGKYEEIQSVASLQIANMMWRNPISNLTRSILVFGVEPDKETFNLPGLSPYRNNLKLFRRVLFDIKSRPEFGPVASLYESGERIQTELNKKLVDVAGCFELGASFSADGNLITSDTTFRSLLPANEKDDIHIGLIRLKPGVDSTAFAMILNDEFAGDLIARTVPELADVEKNYWASSTGVGFVFGLGVIVGFIVGVVIVYQILYADVSDHLAEYATLKAIGYTDKQLTINLIQEGLIVACFGFLPGLSLSMILYAVSEKITMIPLAMTPARALGVFGLTVLMCMVSSVIASRKLRMADPAEIF